MELMKYHYRRQTLLKSSIFCTQTHKTKDPGLGPLKTCVYLMPWNKYKDKARGASGVFPNSESFSQFTGSHSRKENSRRLHYFPIIYLVLIRGSQKESAKLLLAMFQVRVLWQQKHINSIEDTYFKCSMLFWRQKNWQFNLLMS